MIRERNPKKSNEVKFYLLNGYFKTKKPIILKTLGYLKITLLGLLLTNCGTGGGSSTDTSTPNSKTDLYSTQGTQEPIKRIPKPQTIGKGSIPVITSRTVLPNYSVADEEIYDALIKTQVTIHVVIEEEEINEEMIRRLLENLYENTMKRTGFEYHTKPTSAYIYVYTTKEKAQSGMGLWIGMISKSHADTKSSIKISDTQMNALSETEENKWGLTYELRQEIWIEINRSEDRAQKDADKKYSLDKPNPTLKDIYKNSDYMDQLSEKYAKELANKYGIKITVLDSVFIEGLVNGWAFPKI